MLIFKASCLSRFLTIPRALPKITPKLSTYQCLKKRNIERKRFLKRYTKTINIILAQKNIYAEKTSKKTPENTNFATQPDLLIKSNRFRRCLLILETK
jgi:hypothetical protein